VCGWQQVFIIQYRQYQAVAVDQRRRGAVRDGHDSADIGLAGKLAQHAQHPVPDAFRVMVRIGTILQDGVGPALLCQLPAVRGDQGQLGVGLADVEDDGGALVAHFATWRRRSRRGKAIATSSNTPTAIVM